MRTAVVHHSAKVGRNVNIGHGVVIGPNVVIGENVSIGDYSVIGGRPEHRGVLKNWTEENSEGVIIEDGVTIHEFVSIHAGTSAPTKISVECMIQNHAHIAHDAFLCAAVTIGSHTSCHSCHRTS